MQNEQNIKTYLQDYILKSITHSTHYECFFCKIFYNFGFALSLNNKSKICISCLQSEDVFLFFKEVFGDIVQFQKKVTTYYLNESEKHLEVLFNHWPDLPPQWRLLRSFVLTRDGNRCQITGCPSRLKLHVHHIEPKSNGGSHNPENLITFCEFHHALQTAKGHSTIFERSNQSSFLIFIKSHFRKGIFIKPHARRKSLPDICEIQKLIDFYAISCTKCKTIVSARNDKSLVVIFCVKCSVGWGFKNDLLEKIGPEISSAYIVRKNTGKEYLNHMWYNVKTPVKILNGYCPKCGKSLIKKSLQNGNFWSCEGFPKCNFCKRAYNE